MRMGFGGRPAPEGTPLNQAVRRWTTPDRILELDRLRRWARAASDEAEADEAFALCKARIEYDFITQLGAGGQLWASGFVPPIEIDSERCEISADLVRHLKWNFDLCEAYWEHLQIIHIEVHGPAPAWEISKANSLREKAETDQRGFVRFEPPATLHLFGERLWFRGPKQQAIIEQLVDAYNKGKRLRTREVLVAAKCSADTLDKAFRGNRNWRKLKRHMQQQAGWCWIELNVGR